MNSIRSSQMEVSIVADGQSLEIYQHNGRNFVAAPLGKPYAIVVRKFGSDRIEVLESVDGRDVLKDQPASLANQGIVITGTWDNRGWRINDNQTRDFVFSDPSASIAAQATGNISGVGVIGVAYFVEKAIVYRSGVQQTANIGQVKSLSADMGNMRSFSADMGTSMGQSRQDAVGHTKFERANYQPDGIIEIQYRSREWLVKEGIISDTVWPSAFPEQNTGYEKYAK